MVLVVATAAVLLLLLLGTACEASKLAPRLRAGDTVAFISMASPPCYERFPFSCPDGFKKSVEQGMAQYGLNVAWGKHAFEEDEYLAGNDENRAADVNWAYGDPSIRAIVSTRGGEGSARMLASSLLNFTLIAQNPKIVCGYSDITAILNAVHSTTGIVTFHGPMGLSNWTTNGPFWKALVMDAATPVLKMLPNQNIPQPYTITSGKARGKLIGGNLSLLTNILGSAFAPISQFVGSLLFIEDIGEEPYKIDRYLTQLKLYGVLDTVSGIVYGQCTSCIASGPSFTIPQILEHHFRGLGKPVFANAMFGHIDVQFTVPIGTLAELDADKFTITLLEPSVA